jgi:hypothetical protein
MPTVQIEVTADEIRIAKRAVVVLSEMSKIAVEVSGKSEPVEIKSDRLALIRLIRKIEAQL